MNERHLIGGQLRAGEGVLGHAVDLNDAVGQRRSRERDTCRNIIRIGEVQIRRRNRVGRAFRNGRRTVAGQNRRIVHRVDGDIDVGGLAGTTREHRIAEGRNRAVEVGCRRECQHVASRKRHRTVGDGDSTAAGGDRRAVDRRNLGRALKIIGFSAIRPGNRVEGDRGVLVGRHRIGDDVRNRGDGDSDAGGLGHAARCDGVGKRRGNAIEVGYRREGQDIARRKRHRTVGDGDSTAAGGDRRAVDRRNLGAVLKIIGFSAIRPGDRVEADRGVFVGCHRVGHDVGNRAHGDIGRVGCDRVRRAAAAGRRIDFGAGGSCRLVPCLESDRIGDSAVEVGVRPEIQPVSAVGRQQQRLRCRNRPDQRPRAAAVGRVVPGSVGGVDADQSNAGHCASVGVSHVVEAAAAGEINQCRNRAADRTARDRSILGNRGQRRHSYIRQNRRIVHRVDGDARRIGSDREGGNAAIRRGVDLRAGRAGALVPCTERNAIRDCAVEICGRLEIEPVAGVEQKRADVADRANRGPVGAVIGRVEPGAIGAVGRGDRDAEARSVRIGHVIEAAAAGQIDQRGNECADRSGWRRRVLVDRCEDRRVGRIKNRRVVDVGDVDGQRRACAIAVIVRQGVGERTVEAGRERGRRSVDISAVIEIDDEALTGATSKCDRELVRRRVEGVRIRTRTRRRDRVVPAVVCIGSSANFDRSNIAAIGAEGGRNAAVDDRARYRRVDGADQGRLELVEIGDDQSIGIRARSRSAAVISQRVEVGIRRGSAETDRKRHDVIGVDEVDPVGQLGSRNLLACRIGLSVGDEVGDVAHAG